MTSLEERLRFENREFREQLGSAMETAAKLQDRVTEVRDLLLLYFGRGDGMTNDEVGKVLAEVNRMLSHRARNQTPSTRQALDAPL